MGCGWCPCQILLGPEFNANLAAVRLPERALPWLFCAILGVFAARVSGCTNPLPGEDLANLPEWDDAIRGWNAVFGAHDASLCRAPRLEYVPPHEFAERCESAACSTGAVGRCAHACTKLLSPQALVIIDAGYADGDGRWVLLHEAFHVLARCTGGHMDGDAAHHDSRIWVDAMRAAAGPLQPMDAGPGRGP